MKKLIWSVFYPLRLFLHYRLFARFKQQRLSRFEEVMRPRKGESLLDVGGEDGRWWAAFASAELRARLCIVVCDLHDYRPAAGLAGFVQGDALTLPFRDGAFDIAFSNAVLEHVGGLERQRAFANEIRRVGQRYFVQVPNKHFPIEPHFLIPFLQYLPVRWQRSFTRAVFGFDEEIHLPDLQRLRHLFPTATIESERFLRLTKAFYIWETP
jgi:hypothetical protein